MRRLNCFAQLLLVFHFCTSLQAVTYETSLLVPPKPLTEFRAAWVPSVGENSWLLQTGTSTARQKAELIAIMDRAVELKLNAIIFHARPACDALYASKIEPWSEYLTGTMGKAPWPYYDPLQFAIEEAHRRGLELHAWFNPYRASDSSGKLPMAPNHISRTRPDWVRRYGKNLWLDPGEHGVPDYIIGVVMDVVKRYDVDGVQFDDYFYPDREPSTASLDFPDDTSWKKFGASGKLSRDDWRRENVNSFIQRAYSSIKAAKPWIKFGISPRGIWRTNNPPQIRGKDAYLELYADSRKWLVNGWVDYLAPQLYWPIEPIKQSFPALLNWWAQQNPQNRYVWPGIAAFSADKWRPEEIPNQIRLTRKQPGMPGAIFYSMNSLMRNSPLTTNLSRAINIEPVLVPATLRSSWFDDKPPEKPTLTTRSKRFGNTVTANWQASTNQIVRQWVLQTKTDNTWTTEFLSANKTSRTFGGILPEVIAVSAVSRGDVLSAPAVIVWRK